MSKTTKFFFSGMAVLLMSIGFAAAQDEPAEALTDALSDVAVLDEDAAADAGLPEITIPEDAAPAELLAFVQGLEQRLPEPKTEAEMAEMIKKISSVYKEIADRVLADESATDEERRQATELKVVAYSVGIQMGEEGAAEALDAMIAEMLANAKTDEEKIQAYQVKLQSVAAGAPADPAALDKVVEIADEALSNKDSDELQVFGLEIRAQAAFTRARAEEGSIESFVEFLNGFLADADISQRLREKAQELKLASLLMIAQTDEAKQADADAFFEEVIAGPLSPDTRQAVYQMRIQALMAGSAPQQPGQEPEISPEKLEKLDAIAEKLVKEESEELQSMGYALKSTNLVQRAQADPANIDAIFEFADQNLADNPSETLKKQMIGLKIQGYMLKVDQDPAAVGEMLAFLDQQLAGDVSDETKTRLLTVKMQVLMMQIQEDLSYADQLEKVLSEIQGEEGLERLAQNGWGALYIAQIRNIAENGGSIDDFNAVLAQIKSKMSEMPILGFLVGNIKPNIDQIGKNNGDTDLTRRTFEELIAAAEESENPIAKQVASNLQSLLEVSELQGTPVSFEGIKVGTENEKFSTSEFSGKYYLVDVWSFGDRGYFEIVEDLTGLYKDFSAKGFEIVGVNTDEDAERTAKAVEVLGMTWPVISTKLSEEAEIEALPEAFAALPPGTKVLVGPEGKVELVDDLENIRTYLAEKLGEAAESSSPEETAEGAQ